MHFGPATNLLWKTALPPGNSSPCIWNNRIFLTGLEKGKLETLCVDRQDGKILWRQSAPAEEIEESYPRLGSPASSTPASDGENVYVYFGSFGLLCYDMDGKEQWRKPLSAPVVEFGSGSSPILKDDLLILNCDQDLNSYLLAVDRLTGKDVWKTDRSEFRRGFGTPLIWRHDSDTELVVPGTLWLKSYSLKDGTELWTVRGMARVVCTSPTAGDGLLFAASWTTGGDMGAADRLTMPPFETFAAEHDTDKDGRIARSEIPSGPFSERFGQIDFNKDKLITPQEWKEMAAVFARVENTLLAIRPGGRGDITGTHVAWRQTRGLPYVPSPLYYQGRVYTVKNGGMVSCFDAKTGKPTYLEERLGAVGDYYASPVAADGKIFATSQNGVVVVFAPGESLNVLARNDLRESVMTTPAIADEKLYVRTAAHLYAFGE